MKANGPLRFARTEKDGAQATATVDIIVPVYAGKTETLRCLESLFRTTAGAAAQIIVINDASPDQELVEALQQLAKARQITLLTNPCNLGYAGSVNRGLRLHPNRNVVLLNSDTEVFGNWLERLTQAANKSADIGTVTPLGQGGIITHYGSSVTGSSAQAEELDRLAREVNAGQSIDLPVGVGFCMYIKRSCLKETGEFDASTFVRGYGEENDFCLRALACGWRHVAAVNVFVQHHGERSFGDAAALLRKRNGRVLNRLHPEYPRLIDKFLAADPLLGSRRAIDMERLAKNAFQPVLLITHDLRGGVLRHVEERSNQLASRGQTVVVLQPHASGEGIQRVRLDVASMALTDLVFEIPADLPLLVELLQKLRLVSLEMHHFLRLPEAALALVRQLEVPL